MKTTRHILPAVCITGFIMIIFLLFYRGIYNYAKEKCWQELEETAEQIIPEITAEFEDDVAKLHIMETVLKNNSLEKEKALEVLYLDSVLPATVFERIDIWYPDDTLVSSGDTREVLMDVSFEEIAAKGEYMTSRITDPMTGNEAICYVLPITENNSTSAILIGVIDLSAIADSFRPTLYQGKGNIGVVDSKDGSFLIDSWHDELGNLYEMGNRTKAKGYENIDLRETTTNLETGVVVFESKTTGESLYMYYTPTGIFDWQFLIFAPEDVVFGYLINLRRTFIVAVTIIIFLLILYFIWDIKTVKLLEQRTLEAEEQKELLKTISYKDALTLIGNRMKYMEVCNSLKGEELENIGLIYLDLNGLKQINDSQSHEQGDAYIKKAAEIISEQFEGECYRMGGDEFVVLAVGMECDEFQTKIATIKKSMSENSVSISMGYRWDELCANLNELCTEAEKQMYQEKEAYYRMHDRRR